MVTCEQVVEALASLLKQNFNVERDVFVNKRRFLLFAHANIQWQHFVLSKRIVLDQAQVHDYLFCWEEKHGLTAALLSHHHSWLQEYARAVRDKQPQHMRSRFVALLLREKELKDPSLAKQIKRFNTFHWLKFGWEGWYEILFTVYFLDSGNWIVPRRGRDFLPLFTNIPRHTI